MCIIHLEVEALYASFYNRKGMLLRLLIVIEQQKNIVTRKYIQLYKFSSYKRDVLLKEWHEAEVLYLHYKSSEAYKQRKNKVPIRGVSPRHFHK